MGGLSIHAKDVFTENSSEVMWFGQFRLFSTTIYAKFKIEWYTPDAELFREEAFNPFSWSDNYAWAKLDIQGKDKGALNLQGEWSVKVYFDEELIDERSFWIGYPEY